MLSVSYSLNSVGSRPQAENVVTPPEGHHGQVQDLAQRPHQRAPTGDLMD